MTGLFLAARRLAPAVFLLFLLSASALAQLTTGTINGTVTDPSGAAIPGATITVKNVETGTSRESISNESGRYEVTNLQPGSYEISAALPGFRTSVRNGVTLSVGQNAVVDHALQVGEVTQTVEVTGEAPLVETKTATVTFLVDETKVEDLPLRDRDLTQLAFLQPGVIKSPAGRGVFSGMGDKLTVAGARQTQNLYLLDGVSNSDLSNNPQGASGSYTGAETVQEFQVITNNYSAEYQSAAGGIISAVTKSGTNTIHGSGFWTTRDSALDANSWANNRAGLGKRDFSRNQFGGSFGGPIIRDKTFFFGSYEGFRERSSDASTVTVLSDATRAGLLPPSETRAGQTIAVDPTIQRYLDLWPRPNTPYKYANNQAFRILSEDRATGTVTLVGDGLDKTPINEDFFGAKLDHHFTNTKLGTLSGTFNWNDSDALPSSIISEVAAIGAAGGTTSKKQTLGIGHTSILSATTVNEFKFGYSKSEIQGDLAGNSTEFTDLASLTGRKLLGQINPPNGVTNVGWRVNSSTYVQKTYQFKEGLSFLRNTHSFRTGSEIKLFRYLQDSCSRGCNGVWGWNNLTEFLQNTPASLEIFQPGHDNPTRNLKQLLAGFYFQDNWQTTDTLTLNLGLRYEFATVPSEESGLVSTLKNIYDPWVTVTPEVMADPRYKNDKFCSTPGITPACASPGTIDGFFTNPTLKSFSPRIGFAWAPGSKKFSIRGGSAIFYEYPMLFNIRTALQESPPFVQTGAVQAVDATRAGVNLTMRPGIGSEAALVPLLKSTPNIRAMDYNQSNVTVYRWSLTLQQDLGRGMAVSAGYTGSRGVHLWHQSVANLNKWVGWPVQPSGQKTFACAVPCTGANVPPSTARINPNFSEMRIQSSNADSKFHGLALGVQQRLTHGVQYQVAFNYSKSTDSGSGVTSGGEELPQGQRGAYFWDMNLKRGLSQFDTRKTLTTNFTYDLPGETLGGPLKWVLGGWQMSGIVTLLDGHPLSLSDSSTIQRNAIGEAAESLRLNVRPGGNGDPVVNTRNAAVYYDATNFVPSFCNDFGSSSPYKGRSYSEIQDYVRGQVARGAAIAPACVPADPEYNPGHFGNLGRNTLTSPGFATLDFSIQRTFNTKETHRLQFRAEFFNILNRVNFLEPNTSPYDNNGRPTQAFWTQTVNPTTGAVSGGQITTSGRPRTIQLGLRYTF